MDSGRVQGVGGMENGENWGGGGNPFLIPFPPSHISRQTVRVKSTASSLFASNCHAPLFFFVKPKRLGNIL